MFRNQLLLLDKFIENRSRKPLIIRGARQVGKSTLVRNFAKNKGLDLVEINLERYPQLDSVFKTLDVNQIISVIESLPKAKKICTNSLLFLDEIQATPNALSALRYFYEDKPEIPVIAAGSLLEFVLAEHDFSMPVGRINFMHMGPMTFLEFLLATEQSNLAEVIKGISTNSDTIFSETIHAQLIAALRTFFYIGGMPEAVFRYSTSGKLSDALEVHESIIETYKNDFLKYGKKKDIVRLHQIFDYCARNVGKKVKYSNISREDQSRVTKEILQLLSYSKVISRVFHSNAQGVPLSADMDQNIYKLLFLDVGLMNFICRLDWQTLSRLDEIALVNSGAIAEQFVGQEMQNGDINNGKTGLHYWLREGRECNAEVDFVVESKSTVVPVEVKAGASGTMKSLSQFALTHRNCPFAVRFDLNRPTQHKINVIDGKNVKPLKIFSLPLYCAGNIKSILG